MADLIVTLLMLIALQAVLGFDNLLYISLESKRAPEDKQAMVRKLGIALAIFLRIALLLLLMVVVEKTQQPLFTLNLGAAMQGTFTGHSLIVLLGGTFIIYTATKEVLHMMRIEIDDQQDRKPHSAGMIITMIVLMNLVFSFDSILSAMALTDAQSIRSAEFAIMAIAIVISGILMILLAETVANFLKKNRMYEVLGLFVLFVVGIMLLSEGGHLAHLKILDNEIHPMTKGTFYLVIIILVLTDIVQGRYQKKLLAESQIETPGTGQA